MILRRLQYGVLLVGVGAYFISSGEWISWILLLTAVGLPLLSLLISLPGILTFRARPAGSPVLEMGDAGDLLLLGSSSVPTPPFQGRLRVTSLQTGESWRFYNEDDLPTDHCGGYRIQVERGKVCDYLGLFSLPMFRKETLDVVVRPKELPIAEMVDSQRLEIPRWIPKPGGGFSENHEHRVFRPGDPLNQIHWKLSAKVGDLIIREPMEPVRGGILLTLSLDGTPDQLDRKLGRLLWIGQFLLERSLKFEVRALSAAGVLVFTVEDMDALNKVLDALLRAPQPEDAQDWEQEADVLWHYHVGGDADAP